MYKKTITGVLLTVLFIGGCAEPIGGDYFFDQVQSLEEVISTEDWQGAKLRLEELKDLYKKYDWRLQLLGDESEYEGINEAISRLTAAIKIEDSNQALLELATISAYLFEIYSM
ncbi:DUF4363 family protein [Paucisalibacillus globulus]|uniref:DUF4363 family protein n=1 Tax=Paucisalibacillus globulus TaxID=351095 RepID=UPI000424B48C|nr:DUF4363 family protein [Paucisalibacillus globulus]